jgi:hypothetical protein
MPFTFNQWNSPHRHPARPEVASVPSKPEPTVPECSHCQSGNLRAAGWHISKLWLEKRQDVQCRDCKRYSRLPVGVTLPKVVRAVKAEPVLLANDPRPSCPHCAGNHIQRRSKMPNNRRRWFCADCDRRFVSDDSEAFIDHRKVRHFDQVDPEEEARFLFRFASRHDSIHEMRQSIMVNSRERADLEFLIGAGAIPRDEVVAALEFRDKVLEHFETFVLENIAPTLLFGLQRNRKRTKYCSLPKCSGTVGHSF